VVGDFAGYLHWMSKETGNFVARNRVSDEPIIATPLVVGKFIYAFCSDGELAAYTYR
jgi:outer membrane protein assembly factor BamB